MSASTSTVQQPLGTGQFWAALAVVTMALIVAVVIAFGSLGAPKADPTTGASAGFPAPAYLDRGSRGEIGIGLGKAPAYLDRGSRGEIGNGTAPQFNDHGSRGEYGESPAAGPTARRHFPQ